MDFVTMLINLSREYPAILDSIIFLFAAIGVVIAATGVLDIVKLGRRDTGLVTPGAHIFWKLFGGSSLVNLMVWSKAWSATLWANSDPMGISDYASGGSTYDAAIMAALGIMIITGYIAVGRGYMMLSKLGTVSIEARSDVVGSSMARIVAGTALICVLHIAAAVEASTGFGFFT
ncbi:hypothetical protein [Pseudomonas sp. UMAB-40]|uniref:hypothetical protein n=1 Tax=Pseudomonas sp. UMAB-40 TaxID=1365407 RepID=UPI001C566807|nr:hypothetical protein [Pseudomonas sp. UMAB-40]